MSIKLPKLVLDTIRYYILAIKNTEIIYWWLYSGRRRSVIINGEEFTKNTIGKIIGKNQLISYSNSNIFTDYKIEDPD